MARPQAQETEKVEPTASLLAHIPFTTLRLRGHTRRPTLGSTDLSR